MNVPVIQPVVYETTALVAAYAAGLAVDYWRGIDELVDNWKEEKRWQPLMDEQHRVSTYSDWKRSVQRTLNWTS